MSLRRCKHPGWDRVKNQLYTRLWIVACLRVPKMKDSKETREANDRGDRTDQTSQKSRYKSNVWTLKST